MTDTAKRGRGGRKTRGPRVSTTVRYPEEIHAAIVARADAAGLDVGAYLVSVAAAALGLEAPAYCRPQTHEGRPSWAPVGGDQLPLAG